MLKKFLITALLVHSTMLLLAQNADSLNLVHARWSDQKIARHVRLKIHHFNAKDLFAANENISYVEIKNTGAKPAISLAAEVKTLKTTSSFAQEHLAIAAINGTFFDMKNGGAVDYTKINKAVLADTRLEANQQRARHQKSALVIRDGKLNLERWDSTADWETKIAADNVMLTGPMLVFEGRDQELDSAAFSKSRHPRSAIGIKKNGKVILLTVDGRTSQSAGMSLKELSQTMRWLGCSSAINLDGGGSTTLWVKDQGVVNYPTDNKKWDHEGQRKVANVVLITKGAQ